MSSTKDNFISYGTAKLKVLKLCAGSKTLLQLNPSKGGPRRSENLNYDKDPGIKNITIQSKHLSLSYWLILGPLACVQPGRGRLYSG